MTHSTDKVLIICSEGYTQPERNRKDAEAWLVRHAERAAADPRICQGTHHIEEKESAHAG